MNTEITRRLTVDELQRRRDEIRRGLSRAAIAFALLLVLVAGLTGVTVLQMFRAQKSAAEARAATTRAEKELWNAHLAEARAQRFSGMAGRRAAALKSIEAAAKFQASVALRDEAIAALGLLDFAEERAVPLPEWAMRVAVHPQLRFYAISGGDRDVIIRDSTGAEPAVVLASDERELLYATFSPDGQFIACRFGDGSRAVWEWATRRKILDVTLPGNALPNTIHFTPDGRSVAMCGHEGAVRFYDLTSGAEKLRVTLPYFTRNIALHPAGELVATSFNERIDIFRVTNSELVQSLTNSEVVGEMAWHPDGRTLAFGTGRGGIVLWQTHSGATRLLRGHSDVVRAIAFVREGALLATSAQDGNARIWDVAEGAEVGMLDASAILGVSADGSRIAAVKNRTMLSVWRVDGGKEMFRLRVPFTTGGKITALSVHPSGEWIASAFAREAVVWSLKDREVVARSPNIQPGIAYFTDDGAALLLRNSSGLKLLPWRVSAGEFAPVDWFPIEDTANAPGIPTLTAARTNLLTLVGPDGTRFVELSSRPRVEELPNEQPTRFAAVSPDRRWLARSAPLTSGTAVVELRSGNVTRLSPEGGPIAWSPDGRWLVVAEDRRFTCFDSATWQATKTWIRESAAGVAGKCAFSADGKWLALAVGPSLVQLIHGDSLEYGQTMVVQRDRVAEMAFSKDARVFAVGADSGAVSVWRLDELENSLAKIGLGEASLHAPRAESGATNPKFWPAMLPFGGAMAALVVAMYTFRHQRRLVASYGEIDALVIKRSAELAHAQSELMRAEKMKALGTLAAGIAHDFNNLLSVIRLSNDFLARGVKDDPELREEVDSIQQAVERGRDMVNSILGYSRGKDESKSATDVAQLVEDTIGLLSRQFLSGIRLTLELAPETAHVQTSGARLQQILLNLIVNASEAMNGEGSLRISVQTRPTAEVPSSATLPPRDAAVFVELSVTDSGPGIPAEILPRIFEPFFTTKHLSAKPGTGLGLATVYRIAQDEGFGIAVESQPGAGATFRLFVPVVR